MSNVELFRTQFGRPSQAVELNEDPSKLSTPERIAQAFKEKEYLDDRTGTFLMVPDTLKVDGNNFEFLARSWSGSSVEKNPYKVTGSIGEDGTPSFNDPVQQPNIHTEVDTSVAGWQTAYYGDSYTK